MTTYTFYNPGCLDPQTITTMGLSAKECDNPIGQFGTGLKYAIAIVLRYGGEITIDSGLDRYTFSTCEAVFRNKPFDQIVMHGPKGPLTLPFTLDYGKNWEPWQAFRELESNCRDEGGHSGWEPLKPTASSTLITVSNFPEFMDAARKKDFYFISAREKPKLKSLALKAYTSTTPSAVFYSRGVQVGAFSNPAMFRWDFTSLPLTEDRTVHPIHLYGLNSTMMLKLNDVHDPVSFETLCAVVCAQPGYFEHSLKYDYMNKDSLLFEAVQHLIKSGQGARIVESAKLRYAELTYDPETAYKPVTLTPWEQRDFNYAHQLIEAYLAVPIDRETITVTETLEKGNLGLYHNGRIYISRQVFRQGRGTVVGTLLEEVLHKTKGYDDCTREFQNYLIDSVANLLQDLADLTKRDEDGKA